VRRLATLTGGQSTAAFYACGAALIALALVAREAQWQDDFGLFIPMAYAQGLVYAIAAWLVLQEQPKRIDGRVLFAAIIGVAVLLRLVALATPPNFLSTDLYRYVWDGRVQGAGLNPYSYLPADPALAQLRDEAIYAHINRVDTAPTIYPPFAQLVFFLATRLGESVAAMRLAMLGFEAIAVLALAALLRRFGLPLRLLALYLWHPLPVWEFACGAHIDAVVMAASLLALLAATSGRRGLAGALLAAATLTKFFPLAIAPALYRRWDWRLPAAFLAVVAALYAAYAGAGWKVLGFLPGYASEEGFAQGDGLFLVTLLREVGFSPLATKLAFAGMAVAVLGTLTLQALSRPLEGDTAIRSAAWIATATTILISPHYPWYFCWLVPFICFLPRPSLIWLTSSVFYIYVTWSPSSLLTGLVIYAPFLLLAAFEQRGFLSPRLQEGPIS